MATEVRRDAGGILAEGGVKRRLGSAVSSAKRLAREIKIKVIWWIPISWTSAGSLRAETSSYAGEIQVAFRFSILLFF